MPEIVSCPDCDRKLRVPDHLLGKKVKCPGCSVMFTALVSGGGAVVTRNDFEQVRVRRRDAEDAAPPPRRRRREEDYDDYDDRPRRRRRDDDYEDEYEDEYQDSPRRQRAGWRMVCTGLNLYTIAIWVWVAGLALFTLGLLMVILLSGRGASYIGQIVSILMFFAALVDLVLRTTGAGLCIAVPGKPGTGRKPLAISAFAVYGVHAILSLITFIFLVVDSGFSALANPMGFLHGLAVLFWLTALTGLAALIVFLLANRSAAIGVRARRLGGTFMALLITFTSFLVFCLILFVILQAVGDNVSSPGGGRAFGIIAIVVLLLLLGCYIGIEIWYAFTLQQLRATIEVHRSELR
jgi:hypothetical protein